mgnify:FL=1
MKLREKVLAREINRLMWHKGKTLSTAESCSCGRLATALSEYPGSSEYFRGGIVCYTDEMKSRYLNVPSELLVEKTAVCKEVAVAMVKGAIEMFSTDYAVAMTGIAGPSGASESIPVGTIWMAYGKKGKVHTYCMQKDQGRDVNVQEAVNKLLVLFIDYLKEDEHIAS